MSGDSESTTTSTTGAGSGDTSIRVVVFSGKREDWENWREKFMVKASLRGYEGILLGDDKVPETHDKDGKKKTLKPEEQVIIEANKKGFGDLVLSIDCSTSAGKVAFSMVKGTKTTENPSGNLHAAFIRLKAKFEPNTTPQLVQLTREFHSKKLGRNQDPDIFITNLEALKVKMAELGHNLPDKSLILHVLNSLPEQYELEVKMLEHKMELLKEKNKEIGIEDVRNELNLKYERLKMQVKPTMDHAYYMGTKFKGKCNYCGKYGHKSTECRFRNSNSNKPRNFSNNYSNGASQKFFEKNEKFTKNEGNTQKRENKYCTFCNRKGHDISECRKLKK